MSPESPVVLVTGATGPLGRAAAARFARDGARLAVVGTDRGRLDALGAEVGLEPGRWLPIVADLREPEAARSMVAEVEQRYRRIDVLLHLVGGWAGGTSLVDMDPDELRSMLDQHVWTTFRVMQAVVPGMVARRHGRVIAVSSPTAANPGPRGAAYAAAKAAEEVLVRAVARETAVDGVTANLVVVRTIDAAHERETAPTPRNAASTTPEEIVEALVFLASPAAAAITGARIPLDGRG